MHLTCVWFCGCVWVGGRRSIPPPPNHGVSMSSSTQGNTASCGSRSSGWWQDSAMVNCRISWGGIQLTESGSTRRWQATKMAQAPATLWRNCMVGSFLRHATNSGGYTVVVMAQWCGSRASQRRGRSNHSMTAGTLPCFPTPPKK
jgi:hypothetical protein